MTRIAILASSVLLITGATLGADETSGGHDSSCVNEEYSIVKLYFNYPQQARWRMPGGMGGMMPGGRGGMMPGGMGGMMMDMGASPKPEVVKLFLDQQFVGNAIPRIYKIKPELRVRAGHHAIRVECDGFEKFESNLQVIGGGSTQWIVVEMKPLMKQTEASSAAATNGDAEKRSETPEPSVDFALANADDPFTDGGSDPFGGNTNDPFGDGNDPFGADADDPFGDGGHDDPFGDDTNDPFGGGDDPFGITNG